MTTAETSLSRLALVKETAYGVIPATPAFTKLRYTGESLKVGRQNKTSNEIRPDRNVSDLIQVSGSAEGGFNHELSYGTYDQLLEAVMCGTWTNNVLKNGQDRHSFTLEKTLEQGSTDTYIRYLGMIANTMSLNVSVQDIITGSFGFMGKGGAIDTAQIAGATYTDSPTNDVMNAGDDFASMTISGAGGVTPHLTAVSLEINNNTRMQPVIGSTDALGVGLGRFVVTGKASMYFENKAFYELFLAGNATDLSFTVGGATDKKYKFTLPKIKFTDGDAPIGGNDQDMVLTLPFQGLYDPTLGATLKIERFPAA